MGSDTEVLDYGRGILSDDKLSLVGAVDVLHPCVLRVLLQEDGVWCGGDGWSIQLQGGKAGQDSRTLRGRLCVHQAGHGRGGHYGGLRGLGKQGSGLIFLSILNWE